MDHMEELSLKQIKFPNDWETKPNKIEYMEFVYQEAIDMEVWRKDNEIDILTHHHVTDLSRFFWPIADFEGLVLGAELMVWFFAFDELFDGSFIDDNEDEQYRLSNRMNKVFLEGIIDSNPTGAEKMGHFLRNKVKAICGEKRLSTFNRFIYACVQWVDSVIPFNKLKKNQKSLDIDLYLYHRKFNVGAIPCAMISEIILDPMSTIESCIWSDPRWIKMSETICQVVTLANDCVSYDKEIKENGGLLNPLKFIQIQKNFNLQEAYEYISNYSNELIKQYIELETSFIKSYKHTTGFNSNLIPIVDHLRSLSIESVCWSIQSPRYLSQTHPFVELRRNSKIITKICNLK
ncbi:hypothetical protein ACTFIZ_007872 [Dictyostelium cf. discoideum]